jgi:hypothetical protein
VPDLLQRQPMQHGVLLMLDKAVFIISGLVLVLILVGTIGSVIREARLHAECRADGYKDYECVSILRGRTWQ